MQPCIFNKYKKQGMNYTGFIRFYKKNIRKDKRLLFWSYFEPFSKKLLSFSIKGLKVCTYKCKYTIRFII